MNSLLPLTNTLGSARVLFNLSLRYLLFTGAFYLFFYVWKNKKYWHAKIQQRYPEKKHIFREIKYSFFTILIFGAVILLVVWAGKHGLTRVYSPIDKYGYVYYAFSIALMIFMHDTYFYWTHRAMHWKPLFRWAHKYITYQSIQHLLPLMLFILWKRW